MSQKKLNKKYQQKPAFFFGQRHGTEQATVAQKGTQRKLNGSGEASSAVHANGKPRLRQVAVTCTKGDRTKQVNVFITVCLESKLWYFYYRPLNAVFLSHFFNVMINSHFVTVGVMVVNLIRSNTFFNFLGST